MGMFAKTVPNIHLILLAFLGISAIAGGGALMISPSGKLLGGLPLSILHRSPFSNFLIPGLILFLVLGLWPAFVIFALIKRPISKLGERINIFNDMYWAWSFSIYIAFALIVWIQIETIFIQGVGWLQTFYMFYSIPLIVVALLPSVRNHYKKGSPKS